MTSDDPAMANYQADPRGIMHCLRMLAEEAATLHLARTFEAIRQALEVCATENRLAPMSESGLPELGLSDSGLQDGAEPPNRPTRLH